MKTLKHRSNLVLGLSLLLFAAGAGADPTPQRTFNCSLKYQNIGTPGEKEFYGQAADIVVPVDTKGGIGTIKNTVASDHPDGDLTYMISAHTLHDGPNLGQGKEGDLRWVAVVGDSFRDIQMNRGKGASADAQVDGKGDHLALGSSKDGTLIGLYCEEARSSP